MNTVLIARNKPTRHINIVKPQSYNNEVLQMTRANTTINKARDISLASTPLQLTPHPEYVVHVIGQMSGRKTKQLFNVDVIVASVNFSKLVVTLQDIHIVQLLVATMHQEVFHHWDSNALCIYTS